jgi:hypothetical protein
MTVSCALLCLLAVGACQRSVTVPPPSLQSKIIGKWTMVAAIGDYVDYGVDTKDTTYFTPADYFDFKTDSTLSIMQGGTAYNGQWKIDNNRLYITGTNYMDFAGGFDLPILDQHNLQIHDTDSTSFSTADQKLNLSR